jgi:hypothetical protein
VALGPLVRTSRATRRAGNKFGLAEFPG